MNAQFTGLWAFAYNPETMLRRLVAIFSLMFIFGASVYASDLGSGARSLDIAGDTHWMQVLNGQELAKNPANPDTGPILSVTTWQTQNSLTGPMPMKADCILCISVHGWC